MEPGTMVADRFVVERPAGAGGMGTVYRAHDRDGAPVAIKVIDPRQSRRRFELEAAILAELSHPAIVPYVAHGTTADGMCWLAMQWLEGEPLDERLERGPLSPGETIDVARRTAAALAAVHARGVVHRDVKPGNLFLVDGRTDRLVLVDFGIARAARTVARGTTRAGLVVGTVGYMAPEQATGGVGVGSAADVFSLGVVLHECLTGAPLFVGEQPLAVLIKVVLQPAPPLRTVVADVPEPLATLVAAMLQKDPSARPADGTALATRVAGLLGGSAAETPVPGAPTSLGSAEQHIRSVVLAAPAASPVGTDTVVSLPDEEAAGPLANVRAKVERLGGVLHRLSDGSVVASFAGGGVATDLACSAARSALELAPLLRGWSIAVATGRGEADGTWPTGQAADRASALLFVGPGVRVDPVTAGLVDRRFALGGDEAGLRLVEEESRDSRPTTSRVVLGRSTPFVGRSAELATLTAAFERCVRERCGRALLVRGTAGVGKTRLRYELINRLSPRADLSFGRAERLQAQSPWALLCGMLRRSTGLDPSEPQVAALSRLHGRVTRNVAAVDVARVTTFLGVALGMPQEEATLDTTFRAARDDPAIMATQVDRAFVDLLLADAHRLPVVVVLDDLQWADPASVRAIGTLLRAAGDAPVLVVAFARPDVHDRFGNLWERPGREDLDLEGLLPSDASLLVRAVLGNAIERERLEALVARAGGNPFFLEELARVEGLEREDAPPETVVAILQSRLEALDAEERRALRAASVFGSRFWLGGVAALMGRQTDREHVEMVVARLEAREIVARRPFSRFRGETEWTFAHDLVREAAAGLLTDEDRRLGHQLAHGWLDAAGETDAATLAAHAEQGGQQREAARAWAQAARGALASHDLGGAARNCERAVACGISGPELGAARLIEAQAARWLGDEVRALRAAEEAFARLPPGHPDAVLAIAEVAMAAYMRGDAAALARAGEALGRAPIAGPREALQATRAARVLSLSGAGAVASEVLDHLSASLPLDATDPLTTAAVAEIRTARAVATLDHGVFGDASEHSGAALEAIGDQRTACSRRIDAAYAWSMVGQPERAEPLLRAALTASDQMGADAVRAHALHNLGPVLAARGSLAEALAVETEAYESCRVQGDLLMAAGCLAYRARMRTSAGDPEGAVEDVTRGLGLAGDDEALRALLHGALAEAHLAMGRTADALLASTTAVSLLDPATYDEAEPLARRTLAEALHGCGRAGAGRDALTEALARLRQEAARLADPGVRATFLDGVADHSRLRRDAVAWGLPDLDL